MKKLLVALRFLPVIAFADDKSTTPTPSATTQSKDANSDLRTDKHYVNSDGQVVHFPPVKPIPVMRQMALLRNAKMVVIPLVDITAAHAPTMAAW